MRQLSKLILLLSAAVITTAGCKEENETALSVIKTEDQITIPYKGGEGVIEYSIENPIGGRLPSAKSDQEWLGSFGYENPGEITFQAGPNMGKGARTANVTISYDGAESVIVSVRQQTSSDAGESVIRLITESPVSVPYTGGDVEIQYEIDNYIEGTDVKVLCSGEWAADYELPEYGRIVLHTQVNFSTEPRTAGITLSYPNADSVCMELVQDASQASDAFSIEVREITEREAVISWYPEDPEMTYVNGLMPKSYMEQYVGKEAEFIEDEILNLQYKAAQTGVTIQEYLKQVLLTGDKAFKWSTLDPATEYCAIAFGLSTDGEVLTGLSSERFQTKGVDQLDCTFTFEETDVTPSSIKVRITPDNGNVRYYSGIVSKEEYDAWESDQSMMQLIADEIETWLWIYEQNPQLGITASWSDYTEIGQSEVEAEKLYPEKDYYAYAFGLDEGLITTNLQKRMFRTKEVEITDACTFSVSAQANSSYMADIHITPSVNTTRYYVEVIESAVAAGYSLKDMAAMMLNSAVETGILDKYTYSGARNLNTLYDMDVAPLAPSTDYTVVVFGVEDGKRTTQVSVSQFRTGVLQPSSITFDLSVTDVATNSVTLQCVPSNNNEYYIMGCVSLEQYNTYGDDGEFAQAVVDYYSQSLMGIYGSIGCMGETDRAISSDVFYGSLKDRTEYYAFAFGYMGDITTGVTKVRFSTSGKVYSSADVTMECELINGADLYYQDPYRYPYEEYYNFAVFDFNLTPNEYAESWYFATINNASVEEVMRMDETELISLLRSKGEYKPTTTRRREYWYSTIVAVVLPVDRYGEYGQMRIEEYYADPVAAGLLQTATVRQDMPQAALDVAGRSAVVRMWDGSNLRELPENGKSSSELSGTVSAEEAVMAMRESMYMRFPESAELSALPFQRKEYSRTEIKHQTLQ